MRRGRGFIYSDLLERRPGIDVRIEERERICCDCGAPVRTASRHPVCRCVACQGAARARQQRRAVEKRKREGGGCTRN